MSVSLEKITYRPIESSPSITHDSIAIVAYDTQKEEEIFRTGIDLKKDIVPAEKVISRKIILNYPEVFSFKTWLICIKKKPGIVHFRDMTSIEESELIGLVGEFMASGYRSKIH